MQLPKSSSHQYHYLREKGVTLAKSAHHRLPIPSSLALHSPEPEAQNSLRNIHFDPNTWEAAKENFVTPKDLSSSMLRNKLFTREFDGVSTRGCSEDPLRISLRGSDFGCVPSVNNFFICPKSCITRTLRMSARERNTSNTSVQQHATSGNHLWCPIFRLRMN